MSRCCHFIALTVMSLYSIVCINNVFKHIFKLLSIALDKAKDGGDGIISSPLTV